jgi:hypothetical protein
MIRNRQTSSLALATAVAVSLGLALGSATAGAGERGAHAPRQVAQQSHRAQRGDYTRHTERQRTENGYTRRDTWQGENGGTASRTATVANDREAGVRTREAVTTLPDGRTRSVTDVTTRTADGYTRQTSVTNPNGGTVQRDVQASFDPEAKTWSRDVSVDRNLPPGE